MDFNQLVEEVVTLVKRNDRQAEIQSAIRSATLKAHRKDFYYRDLSESGVQFKEPDFIQNFQPTQIFGSRFRKLKYIRYWNYDVPSSTGYGAPGDLLTPIDIENIKDLYGYTKTDVYYMAGELIQIRTARPLSHCLVGVYLNPVIATPETYQSWIADMYPYAIIYEAARQVFMRIGRPADAQSMASLVAEEYTLLDTESVNRPGE